MNFQPGDLVLVAFPFVAGARARQRPGLVVLDTGDADVVVARVTTQLHSTPYDVAIADWRGAGLLAPSVVRLHKLATLDKTLVRRTLGRLQPADRSTAALVFQRIGDGLS